MSSSKKSKHNSDNPESLRDLIADNGNDPETTPGQKTSNHSLDIDGAINPELELKFNAHINT